MVISKINNIWILSHILCQCNWKGNIQILLKATHVLLDIQDDLLNLGTVEINFILHVQ